MAGFAHGNGRVRAIGDVQAQRMQGVGEMIGLEPVAGDAGFLPDARASGACGFVATCALANPGAGRGRPLRSGAPSVERFVDGSELATSSREGWDWPTASLHTRSAAPRLASIDKA